LSIAAVCRAALVVYLIVGLLLGLARIIRGLGRRQLPVGTFFSARADCLFASTRVRHPTIEEDL